MCAIKNIDIAFSFDFNYYKQGYCAILSLLNYAMLHPRKEVKIIYNLYLLISDDVIEDVRKEIVSGLNKKYDNFTIQFVNMKNYFAQAYKCRGISTATYHKLLLHKLLPELNSIIYSDVDVIFNDDLFDISNINMTNYYYGSNIDVGMNLKSRRDELTKKYNYWNTELGCIGKNYKGGGFLLLNLKKLREIEFENIVIEKSKNEYLYQDQDILNIIFSDKQEKVFTIPSKYVAIPNAIKYGVYEKNYNENIISKEDFNDVVNHPAIYHWAGNKPWDKNVPMGEIWWNFVKENTPYYKYFKKRYNRLNMIPNNFFERIFSILKSEKVENTKVIYFFGFKFTIKNKKDKKAG